jgi:hypothetical protein
MPPPESATAAMPATASAAMMSMPELSLPPPEEAVVAPALGTHEYARGSLGSFQA